MLLICSIGLYSLCVHNDIEYNTWTIDAGAKITTKSRDWPETNIYVIRGMGYYVNWTSVETLNP